ncbi:hypothetical protein SRABI80_04746 [Peribacillus frigoritolerans]|uniref:DUF2971 domain-containing protein n=1 Tax=Peribacillus frigoritolerans TaxID=450367 RepID=UPI001E0F378B|nr:DUF2971 domain-containing protein [Peribacillus frigoritolerans]CAH0318347.1 hypothetical protein SRABI80_04746 [Peribacillus frigoritolerans]
MDLNYKNKAYLHAMEFESVYDYSEQYKVDGNPTVWKYMDLEKLDSLLNYKALYFAKPGAFIDKLEGSYSNWDLEQYEGYRSIITTREYMRKVQEFSAVSCWHMNDYESAGMWDLYLNSKDGVAIKTNYKSLLNSITDLRFKVFSGKLQYIDFHKEMTSKNIYDTLFYKRKSFIHENELRLIVIASRYDEAYLEGLFERDNVSYYEWEERMEKLEEESYEFSHKNGNLITCDINKMIEKIYVSPRSSQEVVNQVKSMVSKYGFSPEKVIQSDLYKDFIY